MKEINILSARIINSIDIKVSQLSVFTNPRMNKFKKLLIAFAIFTAMFDSSFAQIANNTGIKIISSSKDRLIVSFKPIVKEYKNIKTSNGINTIQPVFENAGVSNNFQFASPALFSNSQVITVPNPDGAVIENVQVSEIIRKDGYISPVASPKKNNEILTQVYTINDELYSNYNQTSDWVSLKYGGVSRNRYVADLNFVAARYNKLGYIEIPKEITVTIKFNENNVNSDQSLHKSVNLSNITDFSIDPSLNQESAKTWKINRIVDAQMEQGLFKVLKVADNEDYSDGTWLKIETTNEGFYKISASDLASSSVNIPIDKVNTIKIFGNGSKELDENVIAGNLNSLKQQSIIVNKNNDGSLESIIFYASPTYGFDKKGNGESDFTHYINHFTVNNSYLLTWGGSDGMRAKSLVSSSNPVINKPDWYVHHIFYEEEMLSPFSDGSGRQFIGRNYFSKTLDTMLYDLNRNEKIKYNFTVGNKAESTGAFKIWQNDQILMPNVSISGIGTHQVLEREKVSVENPASMIASDGMSRIKFDFKLNNSSQTGTGYFDSYEIHYPRYFKAINNELSFYTNPTFDGTTKYEIPGFSNGKLLAVDVSDDANPIWLENTANDSKFDYAIDLEKGVARKLYISTKLNTPKIQKAEWANLRSDIDSADVILITHPSLINSAEKYKEYRESQGKYKIKIVRTDHIFNEFACGIRDVTAIRDYIAFAFNNWKKQSKYVIFWGGGHFDYRNIQTKKENFVPPYETEDDVNLINEISSSCIDDYFVRVAGDDDKVDLGLGRIPVKSNSEGLAWLEKLKGYENNSSLDQWRSRISLVADDGPKGNEGSDGSMFNNQSEVVSNYKLDQDFQQNKIYLIEYPTVFISAGRRKPECAQALESFINSQSAVILNWMGHGNPKLWAHEIIYDKEQSTPNYVNKDKLFFLVAGTCDFGKFDNPELRSGAEDLFLSNVGGAIAVFSSTRVVYALDNASLVNSLYSIMFTRGSDSTYINLGDMMQILKTYNYYENDEKYYLLGDPTMKLLMPENKIEFTEIDGKSLNSNDTLELKGLKEFVVKGKIINPLTKNTISNYNGTVYLTMYDGDVNLKIYDEDNNLFAFSKYGGALNKSTYKVVNGEFEAKMILPKDISFSDNTGRLFAYSKNDENKDFAKGNFDKFKIVELNTTSISDTKGPEIKIFFDDRSFNTNDVVRDKPLLIADLFDESGINSTGVGIGHKIEAWFDDDKTTIVDLSKNYTPSEENFRFGTSQAFIYNLKKGQHKITIRAWDIFNNMSEVDSYFTISNASDEVLTGDIYSFPNPTDGKITIVFEHNLNPSFNATLSIFDYNGIKIREFTNEITSAFKSLIEYDGLDDYGNKLKPGVYAYVIGINGRGFEDKNVFAGKFIMAR